MPLHSRLDPLSLRVGLGLKLTDRPSPTATGLQLGDRWITRSGGSGTPVCSTLVENLLGARSWFDGAGGGPAPDLATVLAVDNVTGPNSILVSNGQALDAEIAGNDLAIATLNARNIAIGQSALATLMLLINQGGVSISSNAGVQFSALVANRANFRGNQWGSNGGIPGVTGFKSRGLTVGSFVSVLAGDVLWRATAIGVAGDNASIPLAGYISIQVPPGGAVPGNNYVATDFAVELTPLAGPINGHKEVFKISSEGVPALRDGNDRASGLATLDGAGNATVPNVSVKPGTRFTLTVQEGIIPTGWVYQSGRIAGTSFTIKSTAGAADAGLVVYWQLWEPLP